MKSDCISTSLGGGLLDEDVLKASFWHSSCTVRALSAVNEPPAKSSPHLWAPPPPALSGDLNGKKKIIHSNPK